MEAATLIPRPVVSTEEMARLRHAAELVYDNIAQTRRCMDCQDRHFTGGLLCETCLEAKRAGFIRVPSKIRTVRRSKTNSFIVRRSA